MFRTAPREYSPSAEVLRRLKVEEAAKQQWEKLLDNNDPRLTHDEEGNHYWYRLMNIKWLPDEKFDDVIRFNTAPIDGPDPGARSHGVSTASHGVVDVTAEGATHRVSAVSFFRLRRVFEDGAYHLVSVGSAYRLRSSERSLEGMSLELAGFWGRSAEISVPVSDFRNA